MQSDSHNEELKNDSDREEDAPDPMNTDDAEETAPPATGDARRPATNPRKRKRGPRFTKTQKPTSFLDPLANPPPENVDIAPMCPDELRKLLSEFSDTLVNQNALCRKAVRTAVDRYEEDPTWEGSAKMARFIEDGQAIDTHIGDRTAAILKDLRYTRNDPSHDEGYRDFFTSQEPPLFPNQVEFALTTIKLLKAHRAALLALAMGSGKTATALAVYKKLRQEARVQQLVIISSDMVNISWGLEIDRLHLTTPDKIRRLSLGEFRDEGFMRELVEEDDYEIFQVTDVSFCTEDSVPGLQLLIGSKPTFVIWDEAQRTLRGDDSNAGRCLRQITVGLPDCFKLFLSGTILLNRRTEAGNMVQHLDIQTHIHDPTCDVPNPCKCKPPCNGERRKRSVDTRGMSHFETLMVLKAVSVFGSLDEVRDILKPVVAHVVVPDGNAAAAHGLRGARFQNAVLAGHGLDPRKFTKAVVGVELVCEALRQDPTRSVVFLIHNRSAVDVIARDLEARLGSSLVVVIHGGTDEKEKKARLIRVMTVPGLVLVATQEMVTEGVNLQGFCNLCVMIGEHWNPGELQQTLARMYRCGQKGFCMMICLCSRDDVSHRRVSDLQAAKVGNSEAYYNEDDSEKKRSQLKRHKYVVDKLEPIELPQVPALLAGLRALGEKGYFLPGKCYAIHDLVSPLQETKTKCGAAEALKILKPILTPEQKRAIRQKHLEDVAAAAKRKAEEAVAAAAKAAEEAASALTRAAIFGDSDDEENFIQTLLERAGLDGEGDESNAGSNEDEEDEDESDNNDEGVSDDD
jgi:hypothetical protein